MNSSGQAISYGCDNTYLAASKSVIHFILHGKLLPRKIINRVKNTFFFQNHSFISTKFVTYRPISVLLLGTESVGKTEVGHALSGIPRVDFGPTKGVHVYNVNTGCQHVKLTEIGGSDSVRDIWPHYYNDVNR